MSELPSRPPTPNAETKRFWDATVEGRIELPRCPACDLVIYYPRSICPDCQSTELEWQTMAGTGTIYSFTIARSGVGRRWKEHLPFVVAYVRLDEGPTMLTNIVGCEVEDVAIDMAVTAVFDDTGEESSLVRFRPVS